jgi:hypothetical protein
MHNTDQLYPRLIISKGIFFAYGVSGGVKCGRR